MALTTDELAQLKRLTEKATDWELRWTRGTGKRRKMFVTIDIEHRRDVLAALTALETSGERGAPAIRKLLDVIEANLHAEHQRLPWNQAHMAKAADITAAQCSIAVRFLKEQRVLCCRSDTKGRQSPTWEVYAGYASRLAEKKVEAEMVRQDIADFGENGAGIANFEAEAAKRLARATGTDTGIITDERQPPLV